MSEYIHKELCDRYIRSGIMMGVAMMQEEIQLAELRFPKSGDLNMLSELIVKVFIDIRDECLDRIECQGDEIVQGVKESVQFIIENQEVEE